MNYIGIDYGRKRIGLAASHGRLARPLKTITNKGTVKTIAILRELIPPFVKGVTNSREPIGANWGFFAGTVTVVLGLPLDKNGDDTPMSREIRAFGDQIARELGVTVHYVNERYSSHTAETLINTAGSKQTVDTIAATVILQSYLDGIEGDKNGK